VTSPPEAPFRSNFLAPPEMRFHYGRLLLVKGMDVEVWVGLADVVGRHDHVDTAARDFDA